MSEAKVPVVDIQAIPKGEGEWIKIPIPELETELDAMPLIDDPDTGMSVMKMTYRAGHTTTWHTHPCAHGMYVLEGTLVTHQGSFGPGSFVWFPEGGKMQHGATPEEDVTFLFILNKPFGINFCEGPKA
ncbi:cupin domain-containing protein [Kocuria arenosa]|uniref:cupin domain-containing protein n=1 Tax=Kocuria arenosa TaxID=3071446 RepID=UPI0034D60F57